MREPLQEFQGDNYERPNQSWICGLSDEGAPCPVGPGRRGRCPGATACHPARDGDRWVCNRSRARGGLCETGPSPEGECCHNYQCAPLRSMRSRRGRFVFGCALATLGGLCLLFSSAWRNEALAPGELSVQHAQLLERSDSTRRCASCHAAGDQTLGQWIQHAVNNNLAQPSQTELCLECHQKQIAKHEAMWAHNIDPLVLLADSPPPTPFQRHLDPTQELACSTCHREHHGARHDLTLMSDNACQACHQKQYHSFATDHPEFEAWPTRRRTQIAFDHGAHQLKHYPKEKQEFTCTTCHVQDRDGAFQRTLDYEATCGKCHDSKIEASWDTGIALFALPMIDSETLRAAGHDIGQWPEQASEEFDGPLPPITKLLLAADERAATALATLGADFDFFDVDPDDPSQLQAAGEIVWATKRLLHDVSVQGQAALRTRLETVLNRQLSKQEFSALTARLSPENLAVMTDHWLTRLPAEIANRTEEMPASNRPEAPDQDRETARQRVAAGGWLHDETTLSIRYRPTGHADPWVTAWIDVMTEATTGRYAKITKPLLKQMMAPTAAGLCGSCHSVDRTSINDPSGDPNDDRCVVQWFAKHVDDEPSSFTTFSHAPHLTQAQLADCQACHQINSLANVMATYVGDSPVEFENGFQPLTKQSCAECHTPRAAGDSCMQCHRYHVAPGSAGRQTP
ncbi:MAG: hypothetical protein GXP24_12890 [Planctomycetes bacterium]|nr:hypothetical protein [Planctomycetota bacterium]